MRDETSGSFQASDDLLSRACAGDQAALAGLFAGYRERLRRMVQLRLDSRLAGRLDASDILREAHLAVRRRFADYAGDQGERLPFFLWLRRITGQTMTDLHRKHLGTQMRDAALEISLHRGEMPVASSASLAAQMLGKLTSASRAAIRAEQRLIVQEALNRLDPIDREVLVLRHLEHLTNAEVALVLDLGKTAASQRYVRALVRLKDILAAIPGLPGPS
jgi:RNA polymerase sigma-70 factor (ECF subfamily)